MTERSAPPAREGEFDYVNRYYGLSLTKNCRVEHPRTGKSGQVVKGDGHYIHIRWDGAAKADGPYHPTDGLVYPDAVDISQQK